MHGRGFFRALILALGVNCGVVAGVPVAMARDYGPHPGYLETITNERDDIVHDIVIFTPPPPQGKMLKDRIFNEKLTREFTERYEAKFGRTEQLRVFNSPNRLTYYDDLFGFHGTAQEDNEEHRRFGNFMLRRLAEFHIENYAKSDPKVRPIWEAKERISQVKLQVGPRVRFQAKYSLSANSADIKIDNPIANAKVSLQLGGGSVEETTISLARPITSTISAESHYALTDGIISLIGRKSLSPTLGLSATTSTYTHRHGTSVRESLYVAGVSYIF